MSQPITLPWTHHAEGQSPAAVALVFCQLMDPPREPGHVMRYWRGRNVHGWFDVQDTNEKFAIKGTPDGDWTIKRDGDE